MPYRALKALASAVRNPWKGGPATTTWPSSLALRCSSCHFAGSGVCADAAAHSDIAHATLSVSPRIRAGLVRIGPTLVCDTRCYDPNLAVLDIATAGNASRRRSAIRGLSRRNVLKIVPQVGIAAET